MTPIKIYVEVVFSIAGKYTTSGRQDNGQNKRIRIFPIGYIGEHGEEMKYNASR